MKKLFPIFILMYLVSCQSKPIIPENVFPPNETTPISMEAASIRIVSKDNQEVVTKDDIRVKRVQYLLTELTIDGEDLSFNGKCNLLETSTRILENQYGVKMTMQEYLEEMKKAKDLKVAESLNQKPTFGTLASLVAVKKGR